MKRVWKVTNAYAKAKMSYAQPKSLTGSPTLFNSAKTSNCLVNKQFFTLRCCFSSSGLLSDTGSFVKEESLVRKVDLPISRILMLKDKLVLNQYDSEKISEILERTALSLFQSYPNGEALVDLLYKLKPYPILALEVFDWRKKHANVSSPMKSREYAMAITIAGRDNNLDLAVKLFMEANKMGLKCSSTYNALMSVYMYNGLPEKCQAIFMDFKNDKTCSPTIVTYNIIISVYGRLMLVDCMEATFEKTKDLKLEPTVYTYNNLIAGYVTAWMWEDMERVFKTMEDGSVRPNLDTFSLMLRGYAHWGNLVMMEKIYELVKDYVNKNELILVIAMICAYCKSSDSDKIRKIEVLMRFVSKEEMKPWLIVSLIKVYAQADMLEGMEKFIDMAVDMKVSVRALDALSAIMACYYRSNALDKLNNFAKLAERFGWRTSRALYHTRMLLCSHQDLTEQMERVFKEMRKSHIDPVKRTYIILYRSFTESNQKNKVDVVLAVMLKHGYGIPLDAYPS